MSDVYHNPKTGEVWEDGKTYPNQAAYEASQAESPRLGDQATGLLHRASQGLTYGVGDKVLAGIDAASSGGSYVDSLAKVKARAGQADASLPPVAGAVAEGMGTVLSPAGLLAKGAGAIKGGAGLAALYAAGNSEGGPLQTVKEMGESAMTGPILGKLTEAVGNAPGAIKQAIGNWVAANPKVADMMARRLVGTPTGEAITNLLHGQPGQYAETVTKLGLHEPMSKGGRVDQAKSALEAMGPEYAALRDGRSVPAEDVANVLGKKYPGAEEAESALASEQKHFQSLTADAPGKDVYDRAIANGYPPAVAAKVSGYTAEGSSQVPLQDVGTRMALLKNRLSKVRDTVGEGRSTAALEDAISGLDKVQASALSPEEQASLKDLNRRYAIGTSAAESTARQSLQPPNMMRRGAEGMLAAGVGSAITHAMGLGPLPGAAAGLAISQTHPVARAALKAYAYRFNAPSSTLPAVAKAVSKAAPMAGDAIAKALSDEEPQKAAVEMAKTQATDQKARVAVHDSAE